MKLATLMKSNTIQGDIRLSVWNEYGDEVEVEYLRYVDNLACEPSAKKWKNKTVTFIFCADDGFLHIELKA